MSKASFNSSSDIPQRIRENQTESTENKSCISYSFLQTVVQDDKLCMVVKPMQRCSCRKFVTAILVYSMFYVMFCNRRISRPTGRYTDSLLSKNASIMSINVDYNTAKVGICQQHS